MKLIYKFILVVFLTLISSIIYLSVIGIETKKFNNQISYKIKEIDKNLEIDLKKIKLLLNPFKLKINAKTLGSRIIFRNNVIEIENITSQISIKSLINNKFSVEKIELSTKAVDLKNLVKFVRSIQKDPKLFILEKIIGKGYLISDLKIEFDKDGKIKDNFSINGFVKGVKLNIPKKYNVEKIDFIFDYKKDQLELRDTSFVLNGFNFLSEKILSKNTKKSFLIDGNIKHEKLVLNSNNIKLFLTPFFENIDIEKISFSSKTNFSFEFDKEFKFKNPVIKSKLILDELVVVNKLSTKSIFPESKKNINLLNNKLDIIYKGKELFLEGNGKVLFQKNTDQIAYNLIKKKDDLIFKTSLNIKNNPILFENLNFKKDQNIETQINFEGILKKDFSSQINLLSLRDNDTEILIKDLFLNKNLKIVDLHMIKLNYMDQEKQKNIIKLQKEKNNLLLKGSFFNANSYINSLLDSDNSQADNFFINKRIKIMIDEVYLDKDNNLKDLKGFVSFKNNKIYEAKLNGNFSNEKKMKFTINRVGNEKITTLYLDKAKPIVNRYKFIKGFDGGTLDFYSSKNNDLSIATLKIYDFKLKELPVLTKILTLASLQGIADILTGEGIRFDEFEMNFKSKKNLTTIDEIYAIGPAISILMNGYIENKKLVSLRGTLVPATTINKFIGTLPVLGKILVGKKTGEGVFGVSFKIKGPPKNLETTVNPIKTLTPRFITRTLENIKKN